MFNISSSFRLKNNFIKKFNKKMVAIYDLDKINCSHDFLVFFQNANYHKKINKMKTLDIIILSGSSSGFKKEQFQREKNFKLEYAKSRLENIIYPSLHMFSNSFDNFYFIKDRNEFNLGLIKSKYKLIFPQKYNLNINKKEYVKYCIWANLEKNYKTFNLTPLKVSKILVKKVFKSLNTKKKLSLSL